MAFPWWVLSWFGDVDRLLVPAAHSDRDDNVLLELLMTLFYMRFQFARKSIAVYWHSSVPVRIRTEGYGAAVDEACVGCYVVMPAVSSGVSY